MRVVRYEEAAPFLGRIRPTLAPRAVENNLLLGLANELAGSTPPAGTCLAAVEEAGALRAAAVLMPPFKLVLSEGEAAALAALLADLGERGPPGVVGPAAASEACAAAWSARAGRRPRPGIEMVLHMLREPPVAERAPGAMRRAQPEEAEMLAAWMAHFAEEAHLDPAERRAAPALVRRAIERRRLRVWAEPAGDAPVAMADYHPIGEGPARIGPVYATPGARGHGYGTALVATLAEALLRSGSSCCLIFADIANPRATAIYRRIGFEPVGRYREFYFD